MQCAIEMAIESGTRISFELNYKRKEKKQTKFMILFIILNDGEVKVVWFEIEWDAHWPQLHCEAAF